MKDIIFIASGCLGIIIAVMHGYQGHVRCVAPVQNIPEASKRVLQAIMTISAINWFLAGIILVISPWGLTYHDQKIAAVIAIAFYFPGAIGNFWATKGQHIGWIILLLITALIVGGLVI